MAHVEINIRRNIDGSNIHAQGEIEDDLLLDITSMLGAVLFEALCAPPVLKED